MYGSRERGQKGERERGREKRKEKGHESMWKGRTGRNGSEKVNVKVAERKKGTCVRDQRVRGWEGGRDRTHLPPIHNIDFQCLSV